MVVVRRVRRRWLLDGRVDGIRMGLVISVDVVCATVCQPRSLATISTLRQEEVAPVHAPRCRELEIAGACVGAHVVVGSLQIEL